MELKRRITLADTNMVVNLHTGASGTAVTAGTRFSLYENTGSDDQVFSLVYDAQGVYVEARLMRNLEYVLNMHSQNYQAIAWPRSTAHPSDTMLNTETDPDTGIVRLRLALCSQPRYLTAKGTANGSVLRFELWQDTPLQSWSLDVVDQDAATTDPSSVMLPVTPVAQMFFAQQYGQTFGYNACLATIVYVLCDAFGFKQDMSTLIKNGNINRTTAYVNYATPYMTYNSRLLSGADEGLYCNRILGYLQKGQYVIVEMNKSSGKHYVLATGCGATAQNLSVMVFDPTDGTTKSLAKAFVDNKGTYSHIRPVTKGHA